MREGGARHTLGVVAGSLLIVRNPDPESIPLRSCTRRGAAIDVVADRTREARSQFVLTRARGREMIFWQSARVAKAARPNVALPTARAAGLETLEIVVDTRERYAWKFAHQQATTVKRALAVGDYACPTPPTRGASDPAEVRDVA